MKKIFVFTAILVFALGTAGLALAEDNPLETQEALVHKGFVDMIPADKLIGVDQFYKVYKEVMEGKRKAYLIDVRSHPEFYAFQRSLESYRDIITNNTSLLLSSDSDLFRYMESIDGKKKE